MSSEKRLLRGEILKIRKASVNDLSAIAKMAVKLARQHVEYDQQRFDLSLFEPLELRHIEYLTEQFQRGDTSFLLATVGRDIVGFAFLRTEPQSLLSLDQEGVWLHDIYFEESDRGRGHATAFFDAIISEAQQMGSRFLMLGVSPKNAAGQRFFAKMGLRPTMTEMRLDF